MDEIEAIRVEIDAIVDLPIPERHSRGIDAHYRLERVLNAASADDTELRAAVLAQSKRLLELVFKINA